MATRKIGVAPFLVPLLLTVFVGCYQNTQPADLGAVVPRLIELLNDPDPDVRTTAAQALGKIASPDTASALVRSLNDQDQTVREASAWALGNLGEEVLDQVGTALVEKLNDPAPAVKLAAAQALGVLGGTQAMVALVTKQLRQPDVATRRAAVRALMWLEARPAYHALLAALGDADAEVRQGAVAALGELVDPRSLPAIRDRLLKDPDVGVRGEAAYRLGKFGDRTVVAALQSAASRDPDPIVRQWASWALQQIESNADSLRVA